MTAHRVMSFPLHALFLVALLLLQLTSAKQVNVTVDDQGRDPVSTQAIVYHPPGAWQTGQNCSSCVSKPPNGEEENYNGTFMDASYFPVGSNSDLAGQIVSAVFPFTGESFVFVIFPQTPTSGCRLGAVGREISDVGVHELKGDTGNHKQV